MSACNLHTGHIGAASVQSCEAVVVVGGSVHAESGIGAQLRVVQGRGVAAADSWAMLHPGHQQRGGSPGLEPDRVTRSVAWDETSWSFSQTEIVFESILKT